MTGRAVNVLLVMLAMAFFAAALQTLPRDGSGSHEGFVLGMLGGLCVGFAARSLWR